MTRLLTMIRRRLAKHNVSTIATNIDGATSEQKAAEKRVQKAIKTTRRMNRA
ncbi:MAG: hypothetical protein AB8B62_16700 [Roseobacter sp.]